MAETLMKIEGMSCHHCVMRVEKAISGLPGIIESKVDIGTAKVIYDQAKVAEADLNKAVEGAGYRVVR